MKKHKPLSERLSPSLLTALHERRITNAQAAAKLGVSETYMSRVVAAKQDKVPGETPIQRRAATKLQHARIETRRMLAKRVIKGRPKLSIAEAALQAGCCERTMVRYVQEYKG